MPALLRGKQGLPISFFPIKLFKTVGQLIKAFHFNIEQIAGKSRPHILTNKQRNDQHHKDAGQEKGRKKLGCDGTLTPEHERKMPQKYGVLVDRNQIFGGTATTIS
ncbi:hypothetical protein [uncultured Cohaesibacter sp.]|uniref:hypothetical protein n=1 Tax=uncultured Cohaesibacter sp. TaxID=1002546 RepID=UPI0029C6178D|nr:hypothetical protein [uncultured Cohaesibacter sp.]